MAGLILVGDIGGTNARFALASRGSLLSVHSCKAAEHPGVLEALSHFLNREGKGSNVEGVALGVAGPVHDGKSTITNTGWTVDRDALRSHLNCRAVYLLNDFEALAWSLPCLSGADVVQLHAGKAVVGGTQVVLGPGTGFGAACLMRRDGRLVTVTGEAGHSTFSAASKADEELVDRLRQRFDHVSIERVLSGPGLQNRTALWPKSAAQTRPRVVPARSRKPACKDPARHAAGRWTRFARCSERSRATLRSRSVPSAACMLRAASFRASCNGCNSPGSKIGFSPKGIIAATFRTFPYTSSCIRKPRSWGSRHTSTLNTEQPGQTEPEAG
ncbi:MAG: glucokinase [Xanthobacteraceae bacterium]|nr:glucokinase [Xanthobacteraceae bacterium]